MTTYATLDEFAAAYETTEQDVRRALALVGLVTHNGHPTITARRDGLCWHEAGPHRVLYVWDSDQMLALLAGLLDQPAPSQERLDTVVQSLRAHPAPIAIDEHPTPADEF